METADRTGADRKGGHLARRLSDGRLILRELAQCPEEEFEEFQDTSLYGFFNTNTIWIHLPSLRELLEEHDGAPPLRLIRNPKTVDPRDPSSPPVIQLETAMGSAISLFDRAAAIRVPRSRFAPVKTTDDLLLVRSDAYLLNEAFQLLPAPDRKYAHTAISLDPRHYRFIDQLEEHFPSGPPSLAGCASFSVEGDVVFGKSVTVLGSASVSAAGGRRVFVPDDSVIEGEIDL
jgi:UTP--glucose-1-phosphate uridylyltransferase